MEYIVRTSVKSSVINAYFYNPYNRDLCMVMHSGEKYVYRAVSVEKVFGLMQAKSPGTYFTKNIRTQHNFDKA